VSSAVGRGKNRGGRAPLPLRATAHVSLSQPPVGRVSRRRATHARRPYPIPRTLGDEGRSPPHSATLDFPIPGAPLIMRSLGKGSLRGAPGPPEAELAAPCAVRLRSTGQQAQVPPHQVRSQPAHHPSHRRAQAEVHSAGPLSRRRSVAARPAHAPAVAGPAG